MSDPEDLSIVVVAFCVQSAVVDRLSHWWVCPMNVVLTRQQLIIIVWNVVY